MATDVRKKKKLQLLITFDKTVNKGLIKKEKKGTVDMGSS